MDNLADIAEAIAAHSHYKEDGDVFWENLWDLHSEEYLKTPGRHSLSDFQVFCEDKGLVVEDEYYEQD